MNIPLYAPPNFAPGRRRCAALKLPCPPLSLRPKHGCPGRKINHLCQNYFVHGPVLRAGVHKYREILARTSVLASANKPPPGTTTCAGRPSFARGGGSRRQLDLSAHTWRWARRGKKRREMPHVHQGSYGPPGADNMPRTAGAKRPTAAFARLRRERPQRRNRSARRCARRMRSSLNLSFAQPGASPAL